MFGEHSYECDETPKRNSNSLMLKKKPIPRNPFTSPSRASLPRAKPRTPLFQRQLHQLRQLVRRDLKDGWVDDQPSKMLLPLTPKKKFNLGAVTPGKGNPVSRTLFPPDQSKDRLSYFKDLLRAKQNESEKLKVELSRLQRSNEQSGDFDRLKMELVQTKQENETLKEEINRIRQQRLRSEDDELVHEIRRRDDYIQAADKHHRNTIEALKVKFSSELSTKKSECTELTTRLKMLETDKIRLQSQFEAMRERYSQEAKSLVSKMKLLVEERNRLLITNAEQTRLLDEMQSKSQKENKYIDENLAFRMGQLKKNLNNIRKF